MMSIRNRRGASALIKINNLCGNRRGTFKISDYKALYRLLIADHWGSPGPRVIKKINLQDNLLYIFGSSVRFNANVIGMQ